jgi:hypothetical protein
VYQPEGDFRSQVAEEDALNKKIVENLAKIKLPE